MLSEKKKNINVKKSLLKRLVEIINENQYRILVILIGLGFVVSLIYILIINNQGLSLAQALKNWSNWIIVIILGYSAYSVRPLVKQVWEQTDVRDEIEKQTSLKLELENLKLMKELKNDFNKFNISEQLQEKIKDTEREK